MTHNPNITCDCEWCAQRERAEIEIARADAMRISVETAEQISRKSTVAKRRGTQIRFASRVSTIHGDHGLVANLQPNGVVIVIYNSDFPYVIGKFRYYSYREVTTLPDSAIDYRPDATHTR